MFNLIKKNVYQSALKLWKKLIKIIPLLFEEPNPAPIKYLLKIQELIKSDEVRLPLTQIPSILKKKIDKIKLYTSFL